MADRFPAGSRTRALLLIPTALLAACGLGGRITVPPADPVQDRRIQEAVQARLAAEPALQGGSLRVEVQGATVLLYGNVQGIGAWQCALTNAELVPEVRTVVDYLVIERGPRDVRCLAPTPETVAAVKR